MVTWVSGKHGSPIHLEWELQATNVGILSRSFVSWRIQRKNKLIAGLSKVSYILLIGLRPYNLKKLLIAGKGSTHRHARHHHWWGPWGKPPKRCRKVCNQGSFVLFGHPSQAGKPKLFCFFFVFPVFPLCSGPYPIDPIDPMIYPRTDILTGWWFGTFFLFHKIWDNPSHWLSYFSEGLKPPTSYSEFSMVSRRFSLAKTSVLKIGCWLIVALKIGI